MPRKDNPGVKGGHEQVAPIIDDIKSGNLLSGVEAAIEHLEAAGIKGSLIAQAALAGLQLGKALATDSPLPEEASLFIKAMVAEPVTADSFRKMREEFAISQYEIGRRMNVDNTTVYNWEHGRAPLPPEALIVLIQLAAGQVKGIEPLTGDELTTIRTKAGITSEAFAEAVGVHPVTVARWEARGEATLPQRAVTMIRSAPLLRELFA
ncbi:MAG: helix-turn-helix domain-containing protein [Terracidiphilus sp.]